MTEAASDTPAESTDADIVRFQRQRQEQQERERIAQEQRREREARDEAKRLDEARRVEEHQREQQAAATTALAERQRQRELERTSRQEVCGAVLLIAYSVLNKTIINFFFLRQILTFPDGARNRPQRSEPGHEQLWRAGCWGRTPVGWLCVSCLLYYYYLISCHCFCWKWDESIINYYCYYFI
jgi:hypothetical protein